MYRTTPLRGLWQHAPYFHDGSAGTLADAVEAYNTKKDLRLTPRQKDNLVEYLKTLYRRCNREWNPRITDAWSGWGTHSGPAFRSRSTQSSSAWCISTTNCEANNTPQPP